MSAEITVRERQILAMVQRGTMNKDIAATLHLSHATVREYVCRICRKIGVTNRTALAIWAYRQFGMIGHAQDHV